MKRIKYLFSVSLGGLLVLIVVGGLWNEVWAVPVTLTQLTGTTGGSPAATGVWQADLSGLGVGNIQSISIQDNSGGSGGAPGQFSGFDLDGIKLSTTSCASASCAAGLAGLSAFDFSPSGTVFTPGTQRPASDPKLFGTDAGGTTVDNTVATLGAFDGNSTTNTPPGAPPFAGGFISMGDGGLLTFNLTAPANTSGLFLYIGEVGDNGEVAAADITVTGSPVPEPAAIFLTGSGLIGMFAFRRKPYKKM